MPTDKQAPPNLVLSESEGYMHEKYALSYSHLGRPHYLPNAKGWLIKRSIPGLNDFHDFMGCYPLFCCHNWNLINADIDKLKPQAVSLVLITDPFAMVTEENLHQAFDVAQPYKSHFIVRTSEEQRHFVNPSHRRNALRALRKVKVEVCDDPSMLADDWIRLYDILSKRHDIRPPLKIPPRALQDQLSVPGLVMFKASCEERLLGLDLWYIQGNVAHGHLVAFNEEGYKLRAAYATKWTILEYFKDRVEFINLGGGRLANQADGLSYFKKGFSNLELPTWLCGNVFNREVYSHLNQRFASDNKKGYFPEYRSWELHASD